jgi:hypothetical protein
MIDYTYTIATDIAAGVLHEDVLHQSIRDNTNITTTFHSITSNDTTFKVFFAAALSASEKAELDATVQAHVGDTLAPYKTIVHNAIEFFTLLLEEFAAENITLGITVAGKTKEVADLLKDVMRYGQSGSLYEVVGEIDRLEALGWPADTQTWCNTARMTAFKDKVNDYLGV